MEEQAKAGAAFERLAGIISRLRAPDGCPWDREQTHRSLRPHLLEEAYEVLEAIDQADDSNLREELGDLLMQPVMHAQLAAEAGRFDIVDVLESISDKLVRRHPHVFGQITVADSAQVLQNWDAIKRQEKARATTLPSDQAPPTSILDDIPRALPASLAALEVSKKAAKVGFEWPDIAAVMDKLREETAELEADLDDTERAAAELGDLLFTAINVARWKGINPEIALHDTTRRFRARFALVEQLAASSGQSLQSLTPAQWETLWQQAKLQTG